VDVRGASPEAAAAESKALAELGYPAGKATETAAAGRAKATTVAYGTGAKADAEQVAARYGTTATASSAVPSGHVVVTLAAARTPAPSTSAGTAAPTDDPTPEPPMQGPAVKAGGIPCVD
ncbi:LytR C-terminal domain-containing protein, partial [Kitasatospora sp. NPDC057541]|uniref:LytR C-terminal domain-containing protein n=1 Tax=Kitasatospora sp. NPDC057541 TaxID=3346161 RepID=UPI0036AEF4EF